ncbi:hypothetical protein [Streptomyces sp. NPDC054783]
MHCVGDVLRDAGVPVDSIVLPVTDPCTKHRGALGSFAWLCLPEHQRATAHSTLRRLDGIEEIRDRADAVTIFERPADRIGDITVTSAADTARDTHTDEHDLTGPRAQSARTAGDTSSRSRSSRTGP